MPKKKRIKRPGKANAKRVRATATPNPPASQDFLHTILPGFGAYATTRLISRIVWVISSKRLPRVAKHVSAASTILAFVSVWLLGHKVKRLTRYHDSLIVGSGIAALQTMARTYIPRYGWIVSDPRQEDMRLPAPLPPSQPMLPQQPEDEYTLFEEQAEAEMGSSPGSMAVGPSVMPEQNPEELADEFSDMFQDTF